MNRSAMTNVITGLVAVALIVVFLGDYAIKINSLPLWGIIVAVLAMVVYDFWTSTRHRENDSQE